MGFRNADFIQSALFLRILFGGYVLSWVGRLFFSHDRG